MLRFHVPVPTLSPSGGKANDYLIRPSQNDFGSGGLPHPARTYGPDRRSSLRTATLLRKGKKNYVVVTVK
jgi:hypothetical protein